MISSCEAPRGVRRYPGGYEDAGAGVDGDVLAAVEAGADDAGADDEDELAGAEYDAGAEVVVVEVGDVAVAVEVGDVAVAVGVGDVAVAVGVGDVAVAVGVGDVVVGDALAGCDVAAYVGALDEE